MSLMRIVGGGIAVVVALLLVPAYRASRRSRITEAEPESGWNIGNWGSALFQILIVLAYLFAAAGSFVVI